MLAPCEFLNEDEKRKIVAALDDVEFDLEMARELNWKTWSKCLMD
jgi:hypothetical protein